MGTFSTEDYVLASRSSSVVEVSKRGTETWVTFDGDTGATATITASSNITSVARNSEGNYTITFNEEVPVGYTISAIARNFGGTKNYVCVDTAPGATSVVIQVCNDAGTAQDSDYISVRIGC
jgi:hypothetical protein